MSKFEGLDDVARAAFKSVSKKTKKAADSSALKKELAELERFWGQRLDEKFPESVMMTHPRATPKQRKTAQNELREYIMERGFASTSDAKAAFRTDASRAAKIRQMLANSGEEDL